MWNESPAPDALASGGAFSVAFNFENASVKLGEGAWGTAHQCWSEPFFHMLSQC